MSAKDNKREHEEGLRDGRLIPIHVRFVPKDIWIRLHIDSRSTVGAVKDAVLDKLQMPPFDPTVLPSFYDDARYAMVKPAFHPMEARAFPKAFMARCPKRNVAEVVQSDSRRVIGGELWDPVKPSAGLFNAKLKGKGSLAVARELLGGDPGDGGMGSMSYVGNITSTKSPSKTQDASGKVDLLSSASSSPTTSKLLKSVRGAKSPRLRASMLSLGAAAKVPAKDLLFDPVKGAPSDLLNDPTVAAGLDAYVDDLPVTLVGNVDAMRKEEEARAYLERIDRNVPVSYAADRKAVQSARRPRLTTHSTASVSSSIHEVSLTSQPEQTDLEIDDSTDDDSVQSHNKGAATKSLLSSGSDSSIRSMFSKSHLLPSRFKKKSHVKVASLLGGTNSSPDVNAAAFGNASGSGGKSGNLLTGPDAQGGRTSALMMRINSDMSVSSHPLSLKAATTSSSSSLNQSKDQHGHGSECGKGSIKGVEGEGMSHSGSGNSRIAGIQMDEISAWKDAQHALSKFFCVYSYSNGHLLEDWRTVAAFRVRPYELLEIQFSSPRDRVHLPRGGGLDHLSINTNSAFLQRNSVASLVDTEGSQHYIAPCCEGWCYIFKRNSGNNKAQRAGLGVWKLRYLVVRGSRLAIYRKKPARSSAVDAQDTLLWNLNAIECVFSERADGWTRPSLVPLQGLSSDIVTLVFPAEASPPVFVNNETMGWTSTADISLSMRFISQLDTVAFFNTFARATTTRLQFGDQHRIELGANEFRRKIVTRATIAGRGGSVLPGRAGREGGRNALARSRIRPAGVSRDFDDVDRWSSHSEEEGNDKVLSNKGFKYSDLSKGESSGSNKNLKGDFFDPSYKVGHSVAAAPLLATDHISPRGPMASYEPEQKRNSEPAAGASETLRATRPSAESNSKPATRSRGFSFAKAARKALAPSDSSFQSLYQKVSPTMPARPEFAQEGSIGAAAGSRKERRSTQPDLAPATSNTSNADEMSEYAPSSSNNSEQRAPSPIWQMHTGNISRFSQLMSYPSAGNGGRHRSYTLASPNSPPPPSGNRRSVGMRTNSSSSGGNSFHWPFRASHPKTPLAVEPSQLIDGIEGIDYNNCGGGIGGSAK